MPTETVKVTPCPRCIGGKMFIVIAPYRFGGPQEVCLNCGYRRYLRSGKEGSRV